MHQWHDILFVFKLIQCKLNTTKLRVLRILFLNIMKEIDSQNKAFFKNCTVYNEALALDSFNCHLSHNLCVKLKDSLEHKSHTFTFPLLNWVLRKVIVKHLQVFRFF